MKWFGQVTAVLREVGDIMIISEVGAAVSGLQQFANREEYFQNIMLGLYQALAITELKAPQSSQGAFIPVGNSFDAFSAIAKILGAAGSDVLMEVLRLHYRYTVKHWRERFAKNRARAAAIYDERFCRMWEFYLAAVELEFLHGSHMVFQILLSTKRDAVPITRDFMIDVERAAWGRTQTAG